MSGQVDLDDIESGKSPEEFEDKRGKFGGSFGGTRAGTKGFVIFMFLLMLIFLGLAIYLSTRGSHKAEMQKAKEAVNSLPSYSFAPVSHDTPAPPKAQPSTVAAQPLPANDRLANNGFNAPSTGGGNQKHKETPEEAAMKRRLGHDLDKTDTANSDGSRSGSDREHPSDLDKRLETSEMKPSLATYITKAKQNLMIARGTIIPCGTLGELDTTQPGFISCEVSRDVWSMDGKVRLIDKGAHVDGEVASGVAYGQKRVFVNWARLRNPDGVIIRLASPAVGPLGASGVSGSVDNHFWDRFGDAMMISVFADLGQTMIQAVSNLASKAGTTSINTNNSSSSSSQLASQVLQQTLNVQPTLYKQQGDAVAIFVARDLDFSGVYSLTDGQ